MIMNYQSAVTLTSKALEGIEYTIHRMSFGRRIELIKRVRELSQRQEYFQAGSTLSEKIEATLLASEIERLYIDWGLIRVSGLLGDGEEASKEALIERGPERLCSEIVAAIRSECGLSEEERKN